MSHSRQNASLQAVGHSPPSQKRARAVHSRLPLRPETPPPVYEKIPRRGRLATSNSDALGDTLPIYSQVHEDCNKVWWRTKRGIIVLSVLVTTLIIGGVLGAVVGLTASHRRQVSLQGPVGSGSSSSGVISTPAVSSGESASVGGSRTTSPSGPSPSSFSGNSNKTSQRVEATPAAQNPGGGDSGDSGNTTGLGGTSSKTIQEVASAFGLSTVRSPGGGSGGDISHTRELTSKLTIGAPTTIPDPAATSTSGPGNNSPADGVGHFNWPSPIAAAPFAKERPPI